MSKYRIPYHQIQINLTGRPCVLVKLVTDDASSFARFLFHWWFVHLSDGSSNLEQRLVVCRPWNELCEAFTVSDQTIAQVIAIEFTTTKVVNRTEYLDYSGSTNFSGINHSTGGFSPPHGFLSTSRLFIEMRNGKWLSMWVFSWKKEHLAPRTCFFTSESEVQMTSKISLTTSVMLLLIDVQKAFRDPSHWDGNRCTPELEENISQLSASSRKAKLPIIHIKHDSVDPTSPWDPVETFAAG